VLVQLSAVVWHTACTQTDNNQQEKMMEPYGDKIRQIMKQADGAMKGAQRALGQAQSQGGGGSSAFPGAGAGRGGSSAASCKFVNTRGECANPSGRLMGEYGMMSWREYDELKAAGKDPYEVSRQKMNPGSSGMRDISRMKQQR
jgi:hypothetical protein